LLQLGKNERSLEVGRRALSLSEKAGDKGIMVSVLYNLARGNLAVGSLKEALSSIRQSLDIIEELRANVVSPDFRLSYLSGFRKSYELCIEILMQLEKLHPEQGFAAEALLVSEKARARLLRDLISESQGSLRQMSATGVVARERELRELIRRQAQYRMELSLGKKALAEIAAVDNQLVQLRAEYQQVQGELRQHNPRLFSLEQSSTLTLQEIQNQLRDDNTMLLEYALGDERSYVWAVTSNSIQSYDLPRRQIIEDAARELYKLITARQGSDPSVETDYRSKVETADNSYPEKAMNLSQMLLGQLAEQLGSKRLLLVVEGALQHIPFDALPMPASQGALIQTNEVVVLPSVAALIATRKARTPTNSPSKLIAVIADPVLSSSDDRVQTKAVSRGIALAANENKLDHPPPQTQSRNGGLARLTHASEEADAISAVAPWGMTLVVKGFDASRETAMSPAIAQYQILHFATHGILDSEHPELSGIVLSSVDQNGKSINGLMPLHDIYSLDLAAELTVLSACQTALGKDIKGEGLIGLTHSFMSAGAKSVVASLWKVDDRATAVLMADFYEAMFQQGLSPAAALRSAKLKMMQDPQWNAPYYWAGFVLQGEYAKSISVERHSSFRVSLIVLLSLILVALFVFRKRLRRRFAPPHSS
jgi:CHAT domain-containing protein